MTQTRSLGAAAQVLRGHRTWLALALVYAAFFLWYTSLSGPLSDSEIAEFEAKLSQHQREPENLQLWLEFMRSDTGDDFAMFNALQLRELAPLELGLPAGTTGAQALTRYTEPFLTTALRDAAHPVMMGQAAAAAVDVWGIEGADHWDQGALVRYRSRRDLMQQIVRLLELSSEGNDIHRYKIAGLEKTIAFPLDPWFQLGDPRLLLGLVFLVIGFARSALRRAP